jgi:hypothetical protein
VAHHCAGQQSLARRHAERVLRGSDTSASAAAIELSQQCHARAMLARTLWLQGFADQAIHTSRENVSMAWAKALLQHLA